MENLKFKRQYVISPVNNMFEKWETVSIGHNLYANIHPDLEYAQVNNDRIRITLIGYLLDP